MNSRNKSIHGGCILLARKLLKSGIMEKPPLYLKLFIWMLLQASYSDHGGLKRGQFFTSLKKMQKAMAYKIGYRKMIPTIKEIRGVTKFLTKGHMMVTTKVTHGMIITILNYDFYQNLKNYEGHNEGQTKGHNEGTILTRKDKERNNPDFSLYFERYSNPDQIGNAFKAIASTRKRNRVSPNVLLKQLRQWERYPAAIVELGCKIYCDKNYATEGKDETYLMGIIRKLNNKPQNVYRSPAKITDEEIYQNGKPSPPS
jgi:hypothetical protein